MKKLIPLLFLLLVSPSCIFVVSESDHCEACEQRHDNYKHSDYDGNYEEHEDHDEDHNEHDGQPIA
jgi:hypothetical protein